MDLTYAYNSGYLDMPDITFPVPLPPLPRDPPKQYQAARIPFSQSYSCKSTPYRSSRVSNPDSGIEISSGRGPRKVSEVSNPDSGIDFGTPSERRKVSEVSNPDSGIDVRSVPKQTPSSPAVSTDSTAQFSNESPHTISEEEPVSACSDTASVEIEPKEKKSKPTWAERFVGCMKKVDARMDERLAQRQQKKEAREMKLKKRRDSVARTKEVDSWHRQQIKLHLAREEMRNKKAKKQMKEQKREVRQREKKKGQALKILQRRQKQEEKAEREKIRSRRGFFGSNLWLHGRLRKKWTPRAARSLFVQQVVSDRERSLESEEETAGRPAVPRISPERPRPRAWTY